MFPRGRHRKTFVKNNNIQEKNRRNKRGCQVCKVTTFLERKNLEVGSVGEILSKCRMSAEIRDPAMPSLQDILDVESLNPSSTLTLEKPLGDKKKKKDNMRCNMWKQEKPKKATTIHCPERCFDVLEVSEAFEREASIRTDMKNDSVEMEQIFERIREDQEYQEIVKALVEGKNLAHLPVAHPARHFSAVWGHLSTGRQAGPCCIRFDTW